MTLYPGIFAVSQLTIVCTLLVNRIPVVLHCKHEVSNFYLLLFTVDSGFVLVVLTVMAVLSFARLSRYANMLVIILS